MILQYQEKALKHVPLYTKGGLLANCFAEDFNLQKKWQNKVSNHNCEDQEN